ncbi:hypothetical protein IE077_002724 [Cardiosporidium cionae]|uniref:Metallo-beta-lactamase domain-containing protein n=1 Tax=Cardiosporidium cionae TaxID=476202 RepID=A0ABQ7JA37_9APIC|nr:hypothetical protein IE077_002724 [Cardiosporidium cionae]|eukprot:KAF8820868.1 hypothetical protein IE077_002724 [Cardiosporidium cionae]
MFAQIHKIHAIILTHSHQDAMGGLDEVRNVQEWQNQQEDAHRFSNEQTAAMNDSACFSCLRRMPVYLTPFTYQQLCEKYKYIVDASRGPDKQTRKISRLRFNFLNVESPPIMLNESNKKIILDAPLDSKISPTNINGFPEMRFDGLVDFKVTAFPVWHGGGYVSLGFEFGETQKIIYISDISAFPPEVEKYLRSMQIHILILDTLHFEKKNSSHFNVADALFWVQELQPEHVFFVGMHCDIEHEQGNKYLTDWLATRHIQGLLKRVKSVELGYDGLLIPTNFHVC